MGSGSSTSTENAQTAARLFDDGLQAQIEGNSALAANDYLRSLNLKPNDKLAWYDLGLIEQQAGLKANAEHDYEASVADDSRFVPAIYNLGTLVGSTDPARATTLYKRVIAIEPKDAEAHLNLGFALQALGKVAQGNAEIAEAVRLEPSLSSRVPNSATVPEPRAP
jgi:tetratricopeptide (TPR) repeat protein